MISPTFCSAPWFAVRINRNGKYIPCCQIDISKTEFKGRTEYSMHDSTLDQWMTSDYSQYLRKSLDSHAKIPECSNCWQKEASGITSERQILNNTTTRNQGNNLDSTWIPLFLKQKNYSKYSVLTADVKLSNICNFSCAMCSPMDSSKMSTQWANNKEVFFVKQILEKTPDYFEKISNIYKDTRDYNHLTNILEQPLQNLKLLGGEPLLDKKLFKILGSVSSEKKSQIALHFITNGSQSLVDAVRSLDGYRSISFSVSLEGVGKIQEYIRSGSDWKQTEENIISAKQNGIDVVIHHVLQSLSILGTSELFKWCTEHDLKLSFQNLVRPDFLSLAVLPDSVKQKAIDTLSQNRQVVNYISKITPTPEKYPEFLEYVKWLDSQSPVKLIEIYPELLG